MLLVALLSAEVTEGPTFSPPVAVTVAAGILVLSTRVRWFPCPRCGKRFLAGNFFTSSCTHCGLSLSLSTKKQAR